jgi:hypothetical protein
VVTTAASLTWNALSGALSPRNALGAPPPHVNLTDSLVLRTSLGKGFILWGAKTRVISLTSVFAR